MPRPELPPAPTREQLVDLVDLLMRAEGDEAEIHRLVRYLGPRR